MKREGDGSLMDDTLAGRLALRLRRTLPGRSVQEQCTFTMSFGRHFGPPRHDARQAAVIALVYRRNGAWQIPLIVRPADIRHHSSQVSLPGGAVEAGEQPPHAATRELEEELGVRRETVKLLGSLSPLYVFSSNYFVRAFVGHVEDGPAFATNPREVARLLEVPIEYFLDPGNLRTAQRQEFGTRAVAPAYYWDGEAIWGATSMIIAELAQLVREAV
jgi:8-oxo-dGTP pyrophosphatase MutT (NUDIX family)